MMAVLQEDKMDNKKLGYQDDQVIDVEAREKLTAAEQFKRGWNSDKEPEPGSVGSWMVRAFWAGALLLVWYLVAANNLGRG